MHCFEGPSEFFLLPCFCPGLMSSAGRGLHFGFASASASSPKRFSLHFRCCVAVVVCVLKCLLHSMYDGLDGSCSNFHFGGKAALTLKVFKRLSSFLDEKFRAPLILKVGELPGRTMFCADCRHHLCGKHFEGVGCLRILNVLGGVGRRPCYFLYEHLPVLLVL